MLYILTSVWVLRTPNAGHNSHFQHVLVQSLKNLFFAKFSSKFLSFLRFLSFSVQKMLKITISTSVWGAQHPNTGHNIQQRERKKARQEERKEEKRKKK